MSQEQKEVHAAETVVHTNAVIKDNLSGEESKVTETEERFDLKFFEDRPLYVSLKLGKTTPLRNYESAKIEISLMAPVGKEIPKDVLKDLDKTYTVLVNWAESKMQEQIEAIENFKKSINGKEKRA